MPAPAPVVASKLAQSEPSISAKSAEPDARKRSEKDQAKLDVATTASVSNSVRSASHSPSQSIARPAPVIASAQSVPAAAPSRSSSSNFGGGLFAALGAATSGATDTSATETTAQIPAPPPVQMAAANPPTYPEPVVVTAVPLRRTVSTMPVDSGYRVDAGDKLRVVVFGQEGLTNTYAVDAGGGITMPLIGRVVARGQTPAGLAADITGRLRRGYIREPSVAVEVETYRPFFILGEVAAPGQYPYVPNMSVEAAVAIAGGFSPRARRDSVTLTHRADGGQYRETVPLGTSLAPGDTITVGERWF